MVLGVIPPLLFLKNKSGFYEKLRYNTRYRQEVRYEYYNW